MEKTERKEKRFWGAAYRICQSVFRVFYRFFTAAPWLFSALFVGVSLLITYKTNGLYPFGTKTVSWCDMDQQVIPLLLDFKDILAGKEGFFFSFKNAGGMNFYGVFFFFLASPFTFLVAFVEKTNVSLFANILVLLKMCAIAATASLYLSTRNKNAPLLNLFLSVLYAYSGYTMMYYQNVIWLDMTYVFPLLLLGLDKLKQGKRALFIGVLTACLFINYYLSYMIVVFLLLYAFVWCVLTKDKKFAGNFVLSCAVAALLSAIVWLPCFLQYFSSGRKTSIIQSLRDSSMLTGYTTTFPTVFSVLFLFPFAFSSQEHKTPEWNLTVILFLATLVPIVLEPVNKMWQTGSYMSFPTRYAFITIFLCIVLAFENVAKRIEQGTDETLVGKEKFKKQAPRYALSVLSLGISAWYVWMSTKYTRLNHETMDQYASSLWGNNASFEALSKVYAIAFIVGLLLWFLYKKKLLSRVCLWLCVGALALSELYVAPMVYMIPPSHEVNWYQDVVELADKLDDNEGFYRVTTEKEYSGRDFDVNLMGGMGYNALGHYTSLTSHSYMTAIKQFGYTSYWMEVGNSGGTLLTDALLSVKYSISSAKMKTSIYKGKYFSILPLNAYLPMGIITKQDIIAEQKAGETYQNRVQMQARLAEDFFGEESAEGIIKTYGIDDAQAINLTVTQTEKGYVLEPTGENARLSFRIHATEKQAVYFNVFQENTNALTQTINKKFNVYSPQRSYLEVPKQKNNGLLYMGDFENQLISVTAYIDETVTVKEIGAVGVCREALEESVLKAQTIGLTAGKNSLSGKIDLQERACVFLSVALDKGLTLKVNGKKAELFEVYDGFSAFYLEKGENEIKITFMPQGFGGGVMLCLTGVALCAVAFVYQKKRGETFALPLGTESVCYYGILAAGIAVLILVYALPTVLCVF